MAQIHVFKINTQHYSYARNARCGSIRFISWKNTCVAGYEGGDISTVNPYKAPIVMDGLRPLHYCGEFNGGSCCSNIMAQEITDGFEHLMNVGVHTLWKRR